MSRLFPVDQILMSLYSSAMSKVPARGKLIAYVINLKHCRKVEKVIRM